MPRICRLVKTLNLAILAHIDAGKTSLTERLLHSAGVIDEIGSVDDGSTRTDTLALERQRGITIKSAVVSFPLGDTTVNLIDTPGHPDFIAEVERVLGVLDGAVLVLSAVEGVQAQTRVLLRALRRLRIPTLFFVNKIDRTGAQEERLLRSIKDKLAAAPAAMGTVRALGTRDAQVTAFGPADPAFLSGLVDLLAEHDDALLAEYVRDETAISHDRLRRELAAQTRRALVHPVFFGSAITGAGTDALIDGIRTLLPAAEADPGAPVSATVFKVERGPTGEPIAYVRVFTGTIRVRDRLALCTGGGNPGHENGHEQGGEKDGDKESSGGEDGKVTAISVFDHGAAVRVDSVAAGRIGKLWGLGGVRIGDVIGRSGPAGTPDRQFSPPTLETVVSPRLDGDRVALHLALTQLAEQDPLINLRRDESRHETSICLYGEVQKEVIEATLAEEYGLDVVFRESTTICVERLLGAGAAMQVMGKAPNPFIGTVGLRIEPSPPGAGHRFRLGVELGSMPLAFMVAVEDCVRETLQQGLYGWQVPDCTVTLTHTGYASPVTVTADFRNLTPLVLMDALKDAGTAVYEPVHSFTLDIPADTFGAVLPVLARLRAVPRSSAVRGSSCEVEGHIPAGQVHGLERRLPSLTRGEGVLESAFAHYEQVAGRVPTRPRSDHNPLSWKEYLLHVQRRV